MDTNPFRQRVSENYIAIFPGKLPVLSNLLDVLYPSGGKVWRGQGQLPGNQKDLEMQPPSSGRFRSFKMKLEDNE
jgi:hypothetical protein